MRGGGRARTCDGNGERVFRDLMAAGCIAHQVDLDAIVPRVRKCSLVAVTGGRADEQRLVAVRGGDVEVVRSVARRQVDRQRLSGTRSNDMDDALVACDPALDGLTAGLLRELNSLNVILSMGWRDDPRQTGR
jgi:hypothetical protein